MHVAIVRAKPRTVVAHTLSQLILHAGTLTCFLAPYHSKYCLKQEYDAAECSGHHFSTKHLAINLLYKLNKNLMQPSICCRPCSDPENGLVHTFKVMNNVIHSAHTWLHIALLEIDMIAIHI